jgi:TRAP transporter TAXI family solute receptor
MLLKPRNSGGIAAVLAALAVGTGVVYWWNLPTTLKLVIPNVATAEQRLFGNFAELLRRDGAGIRLEIQAVDNPATAIEAMGRGAAHLVLVRLDAVPASQMQAVAVLRREPVMLVVPRNGGIDSIAGLEGKTLGVTRSIPPNTALAREILAQAGISPDKVIIKPLGYHDVGPAVRERKVQAVLVVGAPGASAIRDVIADIAREGRGEPTFLPVELTEAVSGRSARFDMTEVPRGAYGGSQPRPPEAISTTTARVRLMTRTEVDESLINELLQRLLENRQRLVAMENPIAALIEPPDTDADATVPVHRGAVAHLNGERRGFLDRYSDWIYFLLFAGSIFGSAFAGLMSIGSLKDRMKAPDKLAQLSKLIAAARGAASLSEIDRIEDEASDIVIFAINCAAERVLDSTDGAAIQLGIEELRATIARVRRALEGRHLAAAE